MATVCLFLQTTSTAVSLVRCTADRNLQKLVLDSMKAVGDACLAFVVSCKASGGNPAISHDKTMADAGNLEQALGDLINRMEGVSRDTQVFNEAISSIQEALNQITDTTQSIDALCENVADASVNYQTLVHKIQVAGKALVDTASDTISKSNKPTTTMFQDASQNVHLSFLELFDYARKAAHLASERDVKSQLFDHARDSGNASLRLIEALRVASISVNGGATSIDITTRQKLSNSARELSLAIAKLIGAAKDGCKGVQACEQAIEQLGDIVAELESQIIFAQAGHLDPVDSKESFGNYSGQLETSARSLVEMSKAILTSSVSSNQEELAMSVSVCMDGIHNLKDTNRRAATVIGSSDKKAQEQILALFKNMVESLSALTSLAMKVSGKPLMQNQDNVNVPEITELRDSAKSFVTRIGEYIVALREIGDESSRGVKALSAACEEIGGFLKDLDSPAATEASALPDEVVSIAKAVATAAAQLVGISGRIKSSSNQDDLVNGTNELKRQVASLLQAGKSSTESAPEDQKHQMHSAISSVAQMTIRLLQYVKNSLESGTNEGIRSAQTSAKEIAAAVNEVVEAAGILVPGGYVDPNDPNVIAERELLAAANSVSTVLHLMFFHTM